MSLHIEKLRLTRLSAINPDLEKAIMTIAENDVTVSSFLRNSHYFVGGEDQVLGFLRVLDAKHLTGYNIYKLLVEKFEAKQSDEFYDYIYNKMPCQICNEVVEFEPLMDAYEKIFASQEFFAKKFSPNHCLDEELASEFGFTNKYDPDWQNAMHQMAKTSRIFHRSLPMQIEQVEIVMHGDQYEGKLLNAKSKHGTIIR